MFALILLAPSTVLREAHGNIIDVARNALNAGEYSITPPVPYDEKEITGGDVAEEIFDLTNNPNRQEEREHLYGRLRSLSVGDIVVVEGQLYVCLPSGWETI